jgi:Protein of unknown function (DUF1579)
MRPFVTALILLIPIALSAQKTADEARRQPNPEDVAKVRQLLALQDEHKLLGQLAGRWEGTLKTMMRGEAVKEISTPGTLDMRWILDGYFLQSDEAVQVAPDRTVSTLSFLGYNPALGHYHRTVMKAGDPREYVSTGTYDPATRSFTFTGREYNKINGDEFQRRDTFRLVGEDQLAYELTFVFSDRSELRAVQGTYTRRAK